MCGFLSVCSNYKLTDKEIEKYSNLSRLIKHRGPDKFDSLNLKII